MAFAVGAALFATSLLLGGMVFFSIGVAPVIFRVLPAEMASLFTRRLFPVYYAYVFGCAAAACIAFLAFSKEDAALMGAVAIAAFWLRQIIAPRLNAMKDAGDQDGFSRGHKMSVMLNLLQIVIAAVVMLRFTLV